MVALLFGIAISGLEMLLCFWLITILMFDASFVNSECVQKFNEAPGHIKTVSIDSKNYKSCKYLIRAPQDCLITLNITSFYGLTSRTSVNCKPELRISESSDSKSEVVMQVLCPGDHTLPTVYQSISHQVKLTYVWLPKQASGFNLHFYFHKRDNFSPSLSPTTSSGSSIHILIIVVTVVVVIGFIICILSHYKMGARSWSEQRRQRHQNHPPPPNTSGIAPSAYQYHHSVNNPVSTVFYVPPSSRRLAVGPRQLDDSNMRLQSSLQHHLDANYPPSISMPDDEEIPYGSWKNFRLRTEEQQSEIYRECVKPPPNRTIFEGASPPPYRSKSIGFLNAKKSGGKNPSQRSSKEDRLPLVMRCSTTSTSSGSLCSTTSSVNSNHNGSSCNLLALPTSVNRNQTSHHSTVQNNSTLSVTPSTPSTTTVTPTNSDLVVTSCPTRNQQTVIGQMDPPPDYSEVVANPSIYHSTATNRRHQNVL